MHSPDEIEFIKNFINKYPNANIVLASDSQRLKKKRVKFATVIIIHFKDENNIGKGAKVFSNVVYENINDAKLSRPFNRLFREVVLVHELYTLLEDVLIDRKFEIHLDINSNEKEGSSVVYGAAIGYITSYVGVKPITKPLSWAASSCADRFSK